MGESLGQTKSGRKGLTQFVQEATLADILREQFEYILDHGTSTIPCSRKRCPACSRFQYLRVLLVDKPFR